MACPQRSRSRSHAEQTAAAREGAYPWRWDPEAASHSPPATRNPASRVLRPYTWAEARAAGSTQSLPRSIPAPEGLEIALRRPLAGAKGLAASLSFCGHYKRTKDFCGVPAFHNSAGGNFLFWSRHFCDWKIGEQLSEQGLCTAYCDGRWDLPPWDLEQAKNASLWSVWDPSARTFLPQALLIKSS